MIFPGRSLPLQSSQFIESRGSRAGRGSGYPDARITFRSDASVKRGTDSPRQRLGTRVAAPFFDRHCTELNESTSEGKRARGTVGGQEGAYGELRLCDQTTMGQQLESTLK